MKNRICKTLIAFTLAFAVFLWGTVFSLSPESVYAYTPNTSAPIPSATSGDTVLYASNYLLLISADSNGDLTISYSAEESEPYETYSPSYEELDDDFSDITTIYGGNGIDFGSSFITMTGGKIETIYGGNSGGAIYSGNTYTINISGGTVETIYGGGNASTLYGDVSNVINISGGTVTTVNGGGYDNSSSGTGTETSTVTVSAGTVGSITADITTVSGGSVGSISASSATVSGGSVESATAEYISLQGGTVGSAIATGVDGRISVELASNLYLAGESSQIGNSEYGITSFVDGGYKIYVSEDSVDGDVVAYFDSSLNAEDYLDYFSIGASISKLEVENNAITVVYLYEMNDSEIKSDFVDLYIVDGETSGNTRVFFDSIGTTVDIVTDEDLSSYAIAASTVYMSGGSVDSIMADMFVWGGGSVNSVTAATVSLDCAATSDVIDVSAISTLLLYQNSTITLKDNAVLGSETQGIAEFSADSSGSIIIDSSSYIGVGTDGVVVAYFDENLEISGLGDEFSFGDDILDFFYLEDSENYELAVSGYNVVLREIEDEVLEEDDEELEQDEVVKPESSGSNITIDKSYTVGGFTSEEIDEETQDEEIGESSGITLTDDGMYYVDGKYDGGFYATYEEAKAALASNAAKETAERDVESFEESTFAGTGIDDGYGEELYQEQLEQVVENADGAYIYDGEEYSSIEEVTVAVANKVKEETYSRNITLLSSKISGSARYCDDSEVISLYAQGATAIEQLAYSDADRLAEIYAAALDTISVATNAQAAKTDILAVVETMQTSGVLTSESLALLGEEYQSFVEMIELAQTNSEIENIISYFEEYILGLDVAKLSLQDEEGSVVAIITQSGGMNSTSQIVLEEITQTAEYQQLLESISVSGDVEVEGVLAKLLGEKNSLGEMSLLSVVDISIDGEHGKENENGKYTVKILAPEGAEDIGIVKILHITDDGIELLSAQISDGYIVWETSSFSEFIIIGKAATSLWWAIVPLSIIIVLCFGYIVASKKEERGDSDD